MEPSSPAPSYTSSTSSHSAQVVSTLMQQLKSGEISRMELFQQLAKLQSGSSRADPGFSPTTTTTQTQQKTSTGTIFSAFQSPLTNTSAMNAWSTVNDNKTSELSQAKDSNSREPFSLTSSLFRQSPSANTFVSSNTTTSSAPTVQAEASRKLPGEFDSSNSSEVQTANKTFQDKIRQMSIHDWIARTSQVDNSSSSGPPIQNQSPSNHRGSLSMQVNNILRQHYSPSQHSRIETDEIQRSSNLHDVRMPSSGAYDDGEYQRVTDQMRTLNEEFRHSTSLLEDFGASTTRAVSSPHSTSKAKTSEEKFYARIHRWKSQKDALREQMKQQLLQNELDECTFSPKINKKSNKVAAKLRGKQGAQSVTERLYQEADNARHREELAAKLKAEEDAEIQRECTFQPKINKTGPIADKARSKYLEKPEQPRTLSSPPKDLEECTFAPKVNPVSPSMVSAKLYLQQNIFERLSRPVYSSTTDDLYEPDYGRKIRAKDFEWFITPRSMDDIGLERPKSKNEIDNEVAIDSAHDGKMTRPHSADKLSASSEKDEKTARFEEFIERQKYHEENRRKKIEEARFNLESDYRPNINKKSLIIMENGRKGDFMERVSKYAMQKEHIKKKTKPITVIDPNCTFKPHINSYSAKRKPRSVVELSRGDLLRKETTQRLMKLKMEQEEMSSLTFRPQLNRISDRSEGKLKILSSPETYLQRVQQQIQAYTLKQRRAVQEKEMEEFAECTFKPHIIESPAYVQRIARSVSITKQMKKGTANKRSSSEKPEWR